MSDSTEDLELDFATEVWFRNPDAYARELAEVGVGRIAWDRGYLVKKRIDPVMHAELYLAQVQNWRTLAIGPQGTAEYRPGDSYGEPSAVYPTFCFGEDPQALEDMVAHPVGRDETLCLDQEIELDERPVYGQEHRVVITDIPDMRTSANRSFLRFLAELQEEFPFCKIHLHGLYGFRTMFSMPFRAVDFEARTTAQKGKVVTPAGREMAFERLAAHAHWATMLGMKPGELAIPRNRCMYNIRSAIWAGKNFRSDIQYRVRGSQKTVNADYTEAALSVASRRDSMSPGERKMADEVLAELARNSGVVTDTTTPDKKIKIRRVADSTYRARKGLTSGSPKGAEGDYFTCNSCSLTNDCKFYREGSVCSVPSSETSALARLFGSRDSNQIIDGLGKLLELQAERIQNGQVEEEDFGELNPEVNKMINALFGNGVKLAKLIDPSLNGGPKVSVNVGIGNGQAALAGGNPNQLMGLIVRELESRGIARADITPEMIKGVLEGMSGAASPTPAIEGHVITHQDNR